MKNCETCDKEFEGHFNKKYCDAKECQAAKKEKRRLQALEYSMRPEVKAKRQEREKREDVKAKKRAYYKRPEVKAARNSYNVKYNREVTNTTLHTFNCKWCNKENTDYWAYKRYCNKECSVNYYRKYRADRKRQGPFELTCQVCDERFIHSKQLKLS
jgi:hypothetical protein